MSIGPVLEELWKDEVKKSRLEKAMKFLVEI